LFGGRKGRSQTFMPGWEILREKAPNFTARRGGGRQGEVGRDFSNRAPGGESGQTDQQFGSFSWSKKEGQTRQERKNQGRRQKNNKKKK